ncbi:MAG TPA: DJ-1/PfpI family protein [Puia sp.]|uniref:GlxA family transcriptional regulator n=1 Tax=Puia sp. TaxID=2045100 RepID=UPI002CF86A84|nr:DJ-1/PfpI family protein [Puia sp.]HVU98254.1 DJ-1/PfpI family protein [Puia sp.]
MKQDKNRVIFYLHNGVHLLDLSGAVQAFYEAGDYGQPYEMVYVGGERAPVSSAGLPFMRLEHYSTVEAGAGDVLIVAGFELRQLHAGSTSGLHQWLRSAAERGAVVASVCTAAFLLAEAGLLDGRECTTHWKYTTRLQKEYPRLKVQVDRLFIKDGNIYTSAGVTTGLDMSLFLLEERHGAELVFKIARELVVYIRRDGAASQDSIYLQYRSHIHNDIHVVQDWIIQHLQKKIRIEQLAALIHTSPRNLTRLFKAATGVTVGQYVEKLRVEKAVHMLQQRVKLASIPRQCGLQSTNQLRSLVKKHTGRLPRELSLS